MTPIKLETLPMPPPEIVEAARTLDLWFKEKGIRYWALGAVCSRVYQLAIEDFAPNLVRLHGHVSVNSGRHAAQKHNLAVNALRALVPKKMIPIRFEE